MGASKKRSLKIWIRRIQRLEQLLLFILFVCMIRIIFGHANIMDAVYYSAFLLLAISYQGYNVLETGIVRTNLIEAESLVGISISVMVGIAVINLLALPIPHPLYLTIVVMSWYLAMVDCSNYIRGASKELREDPLIVAIPMLFLVSMTGEEVSLALVLDLFTWVLATAVVSALSLYFRKIFRCSSLPYLVRVPKHCVNCKYFAPPKLSGSYDEALACAVVPWSLKRRVTNRVVVYSTRSLSEDTERSCEHFTCR